LPSSGNVFGESEVCEVKKTELGKAVEEEERRENRGEK
jgi:hypothetical protein